VRDWLEASGWNKQAPDPTACRYRRQDRAKYNEAMTRL